MKTMIRMTLVVAGWMAAQSLMGQLPAGAPAGSTGQCKDGTYSTAPSKSGACSGHKGVKDWYAAVPAKTAAVPAKAAAPAAMPAPAAARVAPAAVPAPAPVVAPVAAKPAPTPAAAPVAAKAGPAAVAAAKPVAAGGGPGMVWVNTESKVYHCPGTTFYGKTKAGKYMSESDAKAMGAHADHAKPCTK